MADGRIERHLDLRNQKIDKVLELIGQGKKRHTIVDIMNDLYQISDSMVDKYIAEAKSIISSNYDENILMERYNHLYQKCYDAANYKLCKDINDSIAKIKIKEEIKLSGQITTEIKIIYPGNEE